MGALNLTHLAALLSESTYSELRVETNLLPPISINLAEALEGPPGITALLQPRVLLTGPAGTVQLAAPYGTPSLSGFLGVSIGVLATAGILLVAFMLGRASK